MKNFLVSLEQVLSPGGEPKSPTVGLLIQDWDENVTGVADKIIELGHNVLLIPNGGDRPSNEDLLGNFIGNGQPQGMVDDKPHHVEPQVLYYYKGLPDDATEGIPVLTVEEGKVKVSHEGRVKELAEALGMLDDDDDRMSDHEYRD